MFVELFVESIRRRQPQVVTEPVAGVVTAARRRACAPAGNVPLPACACDVRHRKRRTMSPSHGDPWNGVRRIGTVAAPVEVRRLRRRKGLATLGALLTAA